ncbi:MAG: primosomal protein N' [Pseudomonadota bacterium]
MAIARILFPLPLPEPFDYEIPEGVDVQAGSYVKAPLGKQERTGVIWNLIDEAPERALKPLISVYPTPPMNSATRHFITFCARYNVAPIGHVLGMVLRARGGLNPSPIRTVLTLSDKVPDRMTAARQAVIDAAQGREPLTAADLARDAGVSAGVVKSLVQHGTLLSRSEPLDTPYAIPRNYPRRLVLTPEQAAAAEDLSTQFHADSDEDRLKPVLLDGVTGSGKTEVYFEAIADVIDHDPDAQILVLLPEIALTQAVLERFKMRFGATPAPWHSGLSEQQRRRTWREVAHGRARIVAGARSALFLPFSKLRLIIVDEEHDGSFKQEDGVRYHARDMAVARAKFEGAHIILASATPSLESLVNAEQDRYNRLKLTARAGAAKLPEISLIDMREDAPERGQWLSPPLRQALSQTFERGEQSLLFLNRRGYAPLVLCRACGERLKSPGTDSWLTEHRYTGQLVCHLTGFTMPKPKACPHCGAEGSLMGVGPGVERVAEEVRSLLPNARIEIFSSDTAQTGSATRDLVSRMADGEIDVMIGTQIVAKGHNFPGLTLVGIVDADSGLQGGDLRAGERTYQLLSQVAGRAGRADRPGRAMVQTYQPDNPAMQALELGDRDGFLQVERDVRAELDMPPFGRMAALIVSGPNEDLLQAFTQHAGKQAPNGDGITVYGPAPAPIAVVRGRHRQRFLITARKSVDLSAYMNRWLAQLTAPASIRISIDIDPYSFL